MRIRELNVAPLDADGEPLCTLDRETAMHRKESPDHFLASVVRERFLDLGVEYTFLASEEMWSRIQTFIQEEGDCCRFLAFHATEDSGEISLRIFQP